MISPTQKRIAWQVASINGVTDQYPAWTPDGEHASPPTSTRRSRRVITDSLGQPIRTKGSVVVRRGTKVVGRVALRSANRRLLFSVPWPGAQTPGTYSATVTLTDAIGRTTTATQ